MNKHYRQGFIDKCAEMGVDPEHLCKLAARGDQTAKLLKRLSNDVFFKVKTVKPAGKAVTGGWQTAYDVIGAPGGVHHWFDPNSVKQVDIPEVKGRDFLARLRRELASGEQERGGSWFGNDQKDVAEVIREIRSIPGVRRGS